MDQQFGVELDPELPSEVRIAIANLMLAWGAYDSAITYWLAKSLGMSLEVASIMYGQSDIDTKLLRLRQVHEHFGHTDIAKGVKDLRQVHSQRKVARNIIAHSRCVGRSREAPFDIAFSAIWHIKGEVGVLALKFIPLQEIALATDFANLTYKNVMAFAAAMPSIVPPANDRE